jgi:hypothetical protein
VLVAILAGVVTVAGFVLDRLLKGNGAVARRGGQAFSRQPQV